MGGRGHSSLALAASHFVKAIATLQRSCTHELRVSFLAHNNPARPCGQRVAHAAVRPSLLPLLSVPVALRRRHLLNLPAYAITAHTHQSHHYIFFRVYDENRRDLRYHRSHPSISRLSLLPRLRREQTRSLCSSLVVSDTAHRHVDHATDAPQPVAACASHLDGNAPLLDSFLDGRLLHCRYPSTSTIAFFLPHAPGAGVCIPWEGGGTAASRLQLRTLSRLSLRFSGVAPTSYASHSSPTTTRRALVVNGWPTPQFALPCSLYSRCRSPFDGGIC